MRRRLALLAGALVLVTGCGLPLPSGVQVPDDVPAEGARTADFQVLPPGPRADAQPRDVVQGFLDAQSSAEDGHAIARSFLAPEVRADWDDTAGVKVYEPGTLVVQAPVPGASPDGVLVEVSGSSTAALTADGAFDPRDGALEDSYRLRRDPSLGWVLTSVPPGLRLSVDDLDRSFRARVLHFVSPLGEHLVPDRVFLPVAGEPATALVRRLLLGPTADLQTAVRTAVPAGTVVRAVSTSGTGVVTVDLDGPLAELPRQARARLSAQLVWTLRGLGTAFTGLQLRHAGQPYDVGPEDDGEDGVTPRTAWASFDPEGLSERPVTLYVAERRLRTLAGDVALASGDLAVDVGAVSPRSGTVAALTDTGGGVWDVRTGPPPLSAATPVRARLPGLSAPSWGSGGRGLWLLSSPGGAPPQVLLLREIGPPAVVPVEGADRIGAVTDLRVSRDGARIALVAGDTPQTRRVWTGVVEDVPEGTRVRSLRPVGPGVTEVADVAWVDGTTLAVLGRAGALSVLPLRVAADGSGGVDLLRLPGLEQLEPQALAAARDRPLVVAATGAGDRRVLLRAEGPVFVEQPVAGSGPAYPG